MDLEKTQVVSWKTKNMPSRLSEKDLRNFFFFYFSDGCETVYFISTTYQKAFVEVCSKDTQLASTFLNLIFNYVNWAVSELTVAAEEVKWP